MLDNMADSVWENGGLLVIRICAGLCTLLKFTRKAGYRTIFAELRGHPKCEVSSDF